MNRYCYPSLELDSNINFLIYHYCPHQTVKDDHTLLIRDPSNYNNYYHLTLKLIKCEEIGETFKLSQHGISCSTCAEIDPSRPYKQYNSYECVSDCGNYFLFKDNNQCFLNCDYTNFNNINTIILEQNNECVIDSCNSEEGYGRETKNSNKCYKCSLYNKYLLDGICRIDTSLIWEEEETL